MAGIPERECCLKKVLDGVSNEYDFAVIDCPPAVSLLTFTALRAATDVLVPVETGYFALHGLSKQLETLSILCKRCQQQVSVRVLASMYDIRTKMAREILAELRSHFSDRMFKTVINFNTRIKEASSFGQPINEYDPASKGQQDFRSLAQELIGAAEGAVTKSKRLVDTLADQLESIGASATELLRTTQPEPQPQVRPEVQTAPAPAPAAVEPAAAPVAETLEPEEEPISLPESAGVTFETSVESFTQAPPTMDTKLSDYYGVSQIRDAVVFVTLYPRASNVQIAGDFNNWQPDTTCMERVGDSGVWQAKLKLPNGTYRYRLVVDGQWQQDPYNERTELNPYGELNSVVEIQ
jgi:chromosome partitioning protein